MRIQILLFSILLFTACQLGPAENQVDAGSDNTADAATSPDGAVAGCPERVWQGNVTVGEGSTAIAALAGYTKISGSLSSSGKLTDLSDLGCLEEVTESLAISFEEDLPSLQGLEQLHTVGNGLGVYHVYLMTDLDGLSGLQHVGGDIDISFNTALPNCKAEELVARLEANGYSGQAFLGYNEGSGTCD